MGVLSRLVGENDRKTERSCLEMPVVEAKKPTPLRPYFSPWVAALTLLALYVTPLSPVQAERAMLGTSRRSVETGAFGCGRPRSLRQAGSVSACWS